MTSRPSGPSSTGCSASPPDRKGADRSSPAASQRNRSHRRAAVTAGQARPRVEIIERALIAGASSSVCAMLDFLLLWLGGGLPSAQLVQKRRTRARAGEAGYGLRRP